MYGIDASDIMKYNPDLKRVERIPAGTKLSSINQRSKKCR
jgi:hypothetical protein